MTPRELRRIEALHYSVMMIERQAGIRAIANHVEAAITEAIAATREEDARIARERACRCHPLFLKSERHQYDCPHEIGEEIAEAILRKSQPTTGGTE